MPKAERDKLLTRIADLQAALRDTNSADLRATVREAIADCEQRLADLERPAVVLAEQTAG